MSARPIFLAIDAGGTKTDLLLADAHTELARVRTGSIKILHTPVHIAEENLAAALRELKSLSGIPLADVTRTCVGTSGISVPKVADWMRLQMTSRTGGELILCGDEEIALDAAFHGGPGVLVLAGTGNNVVGRTASGKLTRAGGWGPVLGDEGSGHWIGLHAVRWMFRAFDEGRESALFDAVLRAWSLRSREELIARANGSPPPPFAELTPIVVACADHGDAVALHVLRTGGLELARLTRLVLRRMQPLLDQTTAADHPELPPIALAGSILQSVPHVREAMLASLHADFPNLQVSLGPVDPVQGALWRARNPSP